MANEVQTSPSLNGAESAQIDLLKSVVFPCRLDSTTFLGAKLAPLVERLTKIDFSHEYYARLEAFPIIYGYLQQTKLLGAEGLTNSITLADNLFFMGSEIGNMLRRPVLSQLLAEAVEHDIADKPVQSKAEETLRAHLLRFLRLSGYSKFYEGKALTEAMRARFPDGAYLETFQDYAIWKELLKEAPVYAYGLATKANERARGFATNGEAADRYYAAECKRYDNSQDPEKSFRFFTDAGHMYNFWQITGGMCRFVEFHLGIATAKPPALERPVNFLLVEDNPFHTAIFDTIKDANFGRIKPPPGCENSDQALALCEAQGYYRSGERAFEVLEELDKRKAAFPSLVLADIELGEPNQQMNGLQFVEKLWRRERAAGRTVAIMMVYSSNVGPYEAEVQRLKDCGIIKEAWHKAHFSPFDLINAVNNATRAESA